MAQQLDLTTAETFPSITSWKVVDFDGNTKAPFLKVTFEANTGEQRVWRLVPSETVTAAEIRQGLSFINQGKFMTVQGKSLQRWLIEQAQSRGFLLAGTISGTAD